MSIILSHDILSDTVLYFVKKLIYFHNYVKGPFHLSNGNVTLNETKTIRHKLMRTTNHNESLQPLIRIMRNHRNAVSVYYSRLTEESTVYNSYSIL